MSKLFHAEITMENTAGHNITLSSAYHRDQINLTAESPWAGDTETGFGRDVTVTLSRHHVVALRDALNEWLGLEDRPGALEAE